jgi:hypothetical protein
VSDDGTTDLPVNEQAVQLLGDAFDMMGKPMCCPFCGMWWDQEAAERAAGEGPAALAQWYSETVDYPVNEVGDELGTRDDSFDAKEPGT